MAKVELKKPVIEEISNTIADADSIVLVNYSGLTVAQDTELRRTLREAGITYKVYKNTIFCMQGHPLVDTWIILHILNMLPYYPLICSGYAINGGL